MVARALLCGCLLAEAKISNPAIWSTVYGYGFEILQHQFYCPGEKGKSQNFECLIELNLI